MAKKKSKKAAFYVGAWKGIPNYTCMLCPHQTLQQDLFIAHMRSAHGIDVQEPDPAPDEPGEPAEVGNDD